MRTNQQGCLAHTLETLAIDVCRTQETHIQDFSFVIRLASPASPSMKFHLRISEDPETPASGIAGFGVAQ